MEKYFLDKEIKTFCITAETFPFDVGGAHKRLRSLLSPIEGRRFFGISWGADKGKIIYKAAVEEQYDGEAEKYGCERFTIRKGNYITETLYNWRRDESVIGKTFMKLLDNTEIDEKGYCVEIYLNESDVKCIVTLK